MQEAQGFVRFCKGWRVVIAAGVLLCLGAWAVHYRASDPSRASTPFRIGFENSPPYQYVQADGTPSGPAVDIITEAARRAHIPIQWVHAPGGPDRNLKSGNVDLWPVIGILPERRKYLYISPAWLTNSYWMISLESNGIRVPRDVVGRTMYHNGI